MTTPLVRRAVPDDAAALARLKRDTFRETFVDSGFAIPYPPADLARFEAAAYAPDAVACELKDTARAQWIAFVDGAMVAYAHVAPCKLPHGDVRPGDGELCQLYVRDAAQGLGLGRRLLNVALDHLAATRPGPIWLGVWSGNARAQAIYAARGFTRVGAYRFAVGDWLDDEYIYRLG